MTRMRPLVAAQTAAAPAGRSVLTPMAVGATAGAGVGYLHAQGAFPGLLQIGETLRDPLVWAMIAGYAALGYAILWRFEQPEGPGGIAGWLVSGALWNAF